MMPITPIVKHLLIINLIVFVGLLLVTSEMSRYMAFCSPATGYFQPFQIITYMFTHYGFSPWDYAGAQTRLDISHLFFNMLSLVIMGPAVEASVGPKRFLGLYMIAGLVALLTHVLVYYTPFLLGWTDFAPRFVVNGASGSTYGVTIAFATLFPHRELRLIFPPIALKAWVLAAILVAVGLYEGISGSGGNTAHFAHLGGALAGFILANHWNKGGRFLR